MKKLALHVSIVVCVLLGFVVWCGVDGATGNDWHRRERAKLDLKLITAAIDTYQQRTNLVISPSFDFRLLFEPGPNGEPPALDPDTLTDGKLLDPWGNEYVCILHSATSIEVFSCAADGAPGGDGVDADISSRGLR